jgi:hypothetical protein
MSQGAFIHRVWAVVRKAEAEVGMESLSARSRYLLENIGERESEREPMRVADLVMLKGAGTPPTVYGCVAELERGDWIVRIADPSDGRASRLKLSSRAKRAFAKMSREICRLPTT